ASFSCETSRGCRAILSSTAYTARCAGSSTMPMSVSSATSNRRSDTRAQTSLGVRQLARLADDIHVQLIVLAQPPALRTLIAEQLRNRKPADRLAQRIRPLGDHPRECRRHLGPQGDLAAALV